MFAGLDHGFARPDAAEGAGQAGTCLARPLILIKGIPAGIDLLLLSIPYGMTTTYVAMYAKEMGIQKGTGIFFTLMAAGMAISRIFSGRQWTKDASPR